MGGRIFGVLPRTWPETCDPGCMRDNRRVLIIEDDQDVREMMEECLRGRCLVSHAEDGAQALEMLTHRSRRFDALVVDFEMPDLTGAALLELLHARGIYLPALMVSGMPAASHRAREVQAEFISKPFDLDQFETKVDQLLHASRGRRHCT